MRQLIGTVPAVGSETLGREAQRVRSHARGVVHPLVARSALDVDKNDLVDELASRVVEKFLQYRPGAREPNAEIRARKVRAWTAKAARTTFIDWYDREGWARLTGLPQSLPPDQPGGGDRLPRKVPSDLRVAGAVWTSPTRTSSGWRSAS